MFKKFIFAVLSLFYCANIVSSDQLGQDADEQLKTLQIIKIEVLRSFPSYEVKKKLSDVITSYEKSDKSLNSYLSNLKELQSIVQGFKTPTTSKLLYSKISSSIFALFTWYYVGTMRTDDKYYDDIRKASRLHTELKEEVKKLYKNNGFHDLINLFNKIDNSNLDLKNIVKFDKKLLLDCKNNIENNIGNNDVDEISRQLEKFTDKLEYSLSSYSFALLDFMHKTKGLNDRLIKAFTAALISAAVGFALPYSYFKIQDYLINDIEKLIDKAIQDAESKLTTQL